MKFKKLVAFISLGIIFVISQNICADEIGLVADIWCPYNCEPTAKDPGFMIEIAQNVFEKEGHKIKYSVMNWARSIKETRDNKFTAIVGGSRGDAPDFIYPSIETAQGMNFFWVNKENSWLYKNHDSLKNKKIGVINSYTYGDEIDGFIKKSDPAFIVVSGDDALLKLIKMTKEKRIDGFIENHFVLNYILKDLPDLKNQFKKASQNITKDTKIYIAFSPKNPHSKEYADILAKGVKSLRDSGKLKIILNKYGIIDWK